jgi:hypothetical protein
MAQCFPTLQNEFSLEFSCFQKHVLALVKIWYFPNLMDFQFLVPETCSAPTIYSKLYYFTKKYMFTLDESMLGKPLFLCHGFPPFNFRAFFLKKEPCCPTGQIIHSWHPLVVKYLKFAIVVSTIRLCRSSGYSHANNSHLFALSNRARTSWH